METEVLPDNTVLIVGGGPVGLILATTLAKHGTRSVILERNLVTTKWPKMDLTIARSMEIYRRLGIADMLREVAVPPEYPFKCLFSSSLHADKPLSSWDLPSPAEFTRQIRENNDGTMPLEPWLRVSQEIFEAWLKKLATQNDLIDFRAGWKVTATIEKQDKALVTATDPKEGRERVIQAPYVVGCDGANSIVRESLNIEMDGGPIHGYATLVHFRSKDLSSIHKHGQFWHLFVPKPASEGGSIKGAIIAQDEIETWTVHRFMQPDTDDSDMSSEDIIYDVLGGMESPFPIKIDEILVRSRWTPSIAIARSYSGPLKRIFIAGDACHQTVPTGGYGMNTGIADAYDLGWKLAGVIQGWAGDRTLAAYEEERRMAGQLALEWSKIHMGKLMKMSSTLGIEADTVQSKSEEGQKLRSAIDNYLQENDGHNKSFGVEMGYRYDSCICVPSKLDQNPPQFDPLNYTPSTLPGYRAPHVFLSDGSAIFDHFGDAFTLVAFSDDEALSESLESFSTAAKSLSLPLKVKIFTSEHHAHQTWGARMVIVRPDGFVGWHGGTEPITLEAASQLLSYISGLEHK